MRATTERERQTIDERPAVAGGIERRSAAPGPRLLSAQTAAKYLGVPYTTLRDWALRGHLPVIRAPQSRRMWFDRKDLDRIVDQWKERA
jgi:excisionase family DNA binding protein